MERDEVHALLAEIFEEEALLIGGLVAAHDVDDEFVWRLMRNLDLLRHRVVEDIDAQDRRARVPGPNGATPHPAVQEFLAQLRRADSPARGVRS